MLIQASELTAQPGKGGVLRDTVTKMRDVLASASGAEWTAWVAFAGRPYGSYVLSVRHADYGAMLGGLLQVGMSQEWAEVAASADGVLAQPAPSILAEVVAVTGEPTGPKQFMTITKSTLSGLDTPRALAWSLEVAEHVSKLTGQSGLVATAAAGKMFEITWMAGVDTPDELEASSKALSSDAGYLEMLSQAGAERLFIEGSTERLLLAKLA